MVEVERTCTKTHTETETEKVGGAGSENKNTDVETDRERIHETPMGTWGKRQTEKEREGGREKEAAVGPTNTNTQVYNNSVIYAHKYLDQRQH